VGGERGRGVSNHTFANTNKHHNTTPYLFEFVLDFVALLFGEFCHVFEQFLDHFIAFVGEFEAHVFARDSEQTQPNRFGDVCFDLSARAHLRLNLAPNVIDRVLFRRVLRHILLHIQSDELFVLVVLQITSNQTQQGV
jgi:hypothetical protein